MTNREWLLSWDDEFLARALVNYRFCTYCIYNNGDCDVDKCYDGITKWLQAEHKELIHYENETTINTKA